MLLRDLKGDADQKAFDRGTVYLTAAITGAYLVASIILMQRRKPGRGDLLFIRYGGILLVLAGLGAYYFLANVAPNVEMAP